MHTCLIVLTFYAIQAQPQAKPSTDITQLRQEAERGDPAAEYELGRAFWDGRGVRENDAEAIKWFRKSAEQGCAPAQFELGMDYGGREILDGLFGSGPRQDLAEAVRWFRKVADKAVDAGDRESQFLGRQAEFALGVFYLNGKGVKQDWVEGTNWMSRSAEGGSRLAMDKLSWAYFNAKGVPHSDVDAYKWLHIAISLYTADGATSNLPPLRDWLPALATIAKKMSPEQIAEAQRFSQEWRTAYQKRIKS